jgi:hypothetical protein
MDDLRRATDAHRQGDHEGALRILLEIEGAARHAGTPLRPPAFTVMVEWAQLAEAYPPARAALVALRDEHAALLRSGDLHSGTSRFSDEPTSRFWDIAWFNDILHDTHSTHELFTWLMQALPEEAQRQSMRALPAIVAEGDFALAARYMREPLMLLDEVNGTARFQPLLPAINRAPRLAATLTNYIKDVGLQCAILAGLGHADEAKDLRATALAGIESAELRALAQRELENPGTITKMVTDHLATQDWSKL